MNPDASAGTPCVFAGACHETLNFPAVPPVHSFLFPADGNIQARFAAQTLFCSSGMYIYLPAGGEAQLTLRCRRLILVRIPSACIPYPLSFGTAAIYEDPAAPDIFQALANACQGAGQASALAVDTQLLRLYAMHDALARAAGQEGQARISTGAALLELEFLRSEPISRYAQACLMGETRFRTLFSQHYGLSPVEYRIKLRLARAQALIRTARLPVHMAAQAAGFHSVSYFCRLYKQAYGHSPGAGEEDTNA